MIGKNLPDETLQNIKKELKNRITKRIVDGVNQRAI